MDVTPQTADSQGKTANEKNLTVTNNVTVGNQVLQSTANALTALAGGGQAGATPILTMCNRFTTVATIADSAILPAAVPGLEITVINAATNSMNVFPDVGSTINALSANTAFALAGGKTAIFFTTVAGAWHSILSA